MKYLLILCLFFMASVSAFAQTPTEAEIEKRARDVGRSLRCVVCQNQSIDESDAPLAEDMRNLVRVRIRAGDSNEQVIGFMQERYGDYVLLKPPLQANTYALWFAPAALVLGFLAWYILRARRKVSLPETSPLSEDEQKAFDALTSDKEPKS